MLAVAEAPVIIVDVAGGAVFKLDGQGASPMVGEAVKLAPALDIGAVLA